MNIQRPAPMPYSSASQACWTVNRHHRDAVPILRAAVRAKLTSWGIGPSSDFAFAVGLVATELTSNALAYGTPVLHLVDVTVWHNSDAGTVTVIVHDSTSEPPTVAATSADDESGRGLVLVDAYAADHGWYRSDFMGKRVWAVVDPDRLPGEGSGQAATPAVAIA